MLLSNRWGKSEGDHIFLHSLKINYSCSSYLVSTILFMDLFCLFLGIRRMWLARSCNPVLLSPTLPLMQPWVSSGSGSARVLVPAERDAAHGPFCTWWFYEAHTSVSTRTLHHPPCCNSSSSASHTWVTAAWLHLSFCFYAFKELRVVFTSKFGFP